MSRTEKPWGYQGVLAYEERQLGFELSGTLSLLSVTRGGIVQQGQTLARLDDTLFAPVIEARRAELKAADAKLSLVAAGAKRQDLSSLAARIRAAQAVEEQLRDDLTRQQNLLAQGATASTAVSSLQGQLDRAKAEREALEEQLSGLKSGARPQEVEVAQAQRDASAALLKVEEARLSKLTLIAPYNGKILSLLREQGEILAAGAPLLTIADTKHPYVDVFVPQSELRELHIGDAASLKVDAFEATFDGKVEDISRSTEFTPRFLFSEGERENLVIRVRVRISDSAEKLHAGLPAFVRFMPISASTQVSKS